MPIKDVLKSLGGTAFEGAGRSGFNIRYGMGPEEKTSVDQSGKFGGGEADEKKRAASSGLATGRFGKYIPQLFNELRNQFNVGGGDADRETSIRNASISGASKALDAQNRKGMAQSVEKKVQSNPDENADAKEDSKVVQNALDPVARKRALFNALNGTQPGGINGVLAGLSGD